MTRESRPLARCTGSPLRRTVLKPVYHSLTQHKEHEQEGSNGHGDGGEGRRPVRLPHVADVVLQSERNRLKALSKDECVGENELIPDEDRVDHDHGDDRIERHGQGDSGEDPVGTRTIDRGCFVDRLRDVAEERNEQEQRHREGESGQRDDDRDMGIQKAYLRVADEQWYESDLHGDDDPHEEQ